ncbi:hypothetical protein [Faunimonas pinastri]|uniref:hypothetical protein n=1 Tax=Faunimonas pinastri TaxID=1855383 RepID=UPI0015A5C3D3|nr:hypothetical protein [Faunimonas pinastri]
MTKHLGGLPIVAARCFRQLTGKTHASACSSSVPVHDAGMDVGETPKTLGEAELAGWTRFLVSCPKCRLLVELPFNEVWRRSPYRSLADIVQRLRCGRCGSRPDRVALERTIFRHLGGTPESETLPLCRLLPEC